MDNEESDKVNNVLNDLENNLQKGNLKAIAKDIALMGNAVNEGIVEPVQTASKTIGEFGKIYAENMLKMQEINNSCIDSMEIFKKSLQNINNQSSLKELKDLAQSIEKSKNQLGTFTNKINSTSKEQNKITDKLENNDSAKDENDNVDIGKYIDAIKSLSKIKVVEHFTTLKNELKDSKKYFKTTNEHGHKKSLTQRVVSAGNGLKGVGTALNKGVSVPLFKGFKSIIDTGLKNEEKMAKSKGKNVPPGKGTVAVNRIKSELRKLDTSLTKLKISIYNAILPTLLKALPLVIKFINFLTILVDRFNKLPAPIKSFISNIALVSMVIGPVLITLGNLINTVSNVVKVFRLIKAAANIFKLLPALINGPVLITIGIIAGLGLIIYEVIKHWNTIKKYAGKVWNEINTIVKNTVRGTVKFLETAFIHLPKTLFSIGKDIIRGLIHGISSMFGKVKDVVANIAHKVSGTFKKLLGINSPSRVFIGFGQNIAEGLVDGLDRQDDIIGNKIKGISNKIKSIGNVQPNLSYTAVNGKIGSNSMGLSSVNNTNNSNQVTFNPNIKMYINLSDTKENGTKELTAQLESMTMSAMKNTMTNLFMKDAIRSY